MGCQSNEIGEQIPTRWSGPLTWSCPESGGKEKWRILPVGEVHDQRAALQGGALQPLLKAAPLSKSAVSRVIATLKDGLEAWRTRSLADLDVIYVYLDGFALRVRRAGKVVSVPVLGVIGVLPDGHKHLLGPGPLRRRVVLGVERLPR